MNSKERRVQSALRRQRPATSDEQILYTGYVDPTTDIVYDPSTNAQPGTMYVYDRDVRVSTLVSVGALMLPYIHQSGVPTRTAVKGKSRIAIEPVVTPTTAALVQQAYQNGAQSALVRSEQITFGKVTLWSPEVGGEYGLNVYVNAFTYGANNVSGHIDVSAGVPGTSGQYAMSVVWYDTSTSALGITTGTPSTKPLVLWSKADALNIALTSTQIRLGAVLLVYGQTSVTDATTIYDGRDLLTLEGSGVQSIVAGTNVTVDDTDPQNPIVNATPSGGSGLGTVLWDTTLASAGTFDTNSTDDHGNSGALGTGYLWFDVYYDLRAVASVTGAFVLGAFNNDTNANNYQSASGFAGSSSGGSAPNNDRTITACAGASAPSNYFTQGRIVIYNPDSSHFKSSTSVDSDPRSTSDYHIGQNSLQWRDASAITRIAISVNNATTTFAAGSRMTVVGYK